MASALVFLTDKSLPAKGMQTRFDATFLTSKKKEWKQLCQGEAVTIKGDIIVEITYKDKIDWPVLLNALGSQFRTQVVPLITKDSKLIEIIPKIEGYPIHPIALNGFDALGDWYAEYVSGLLKVRLK